MSTSISLFQVDSFTEEAFTGNPAGVCLMQKAQSETWMQAVAAEMNLSETAFLYPQGEDFHLRWFTPTTEVKLCGHATLASAHILFETGRLSSNETARFHTKSGVLTASLNQGRIELNFPAEFVQPAQVPENLLQALGVQPISTCKGNDNYLFEVADESEVRSLVPDFAALRRIPAHLLIVTCHADSGKYDFVSRVFVPYLGINEDPVTGSAHCSLGPYWMEKLGRSNLFAYQASARGGEIHVEVVGERVILGGNAVTVFRGELLK